MGSQLYGSECASEAWLVHSKCCFCDSFPLNHSDFSLRALAGSISCVTGSCSQCLRIACSLYSEVNFLIRWDYHHHKQKHSFSFFFLFFWWWTEQALITVLVLGLNRGPHLCYLGIVHWVIDQPREHCKKPSSFFLALLITGNAISRQNIGTE